MYYPFIFTIYFEVNNLKINLTFTILINDFEFYPIFLYKCRMTK